MILFLPSFVDFLKTDDTDQDGSEKVINGFLCLFLAVGTCVSYNLLDLTLEVLRDSIVEFEHWIFAFHVDVLALLLLGLLSVHISVVKYRAVHQVVALRSTLLVFLVLYLLLEAILRLLVDLLEVQAFLDPGQESLIELSDILFVSNLHGSAVVVRDGIKHGCRVTVLLVTLGHLAKEYLQLFDESSTCFQSLNELLCLGVNVAVATLSILAILGLVAKRGEGTVLIEMGKDGLHKGWNIVVHL